MHGVDIVLCNISEISKLDSGNIMRKAMNFQKEAFKKNVCSHNTENERISSVEASKLWSIKKHIFQEIEKLDLITNVGW